ncbi:MAG: hypothetical protein DWQ07_12050 [Chloroflexi bacterium]|nr:MAG: hypothetical protein DWQ07_12050 [Chloroflexota bacterium]MBL1196091.1 hypothetical protein [Chloroflexota bacterium]NOH13384.1 hypothetical protein [Chloroflexota bacterium]
MKKAQWVLSIFLFFAPLIVALAQISILDFPTKDPFLGIPYSPYPQVLYLPLVVAIVLMILSISTTLALTSRWYGGFSVKLRLLFTTLLIVVNLTLFWFGIDLAQRAVIIEYLAAINANGLHFLSIFTLPIMPELFPDNGEFAFGVTIFIGIVGLVSMIAQHTAELSTKTSNRSPA